MGSCSSRLGSNPSRRRLNRKPKRSSLLSLFFTCGGSSSHEPIEMEDYPAEILVKSVEHCDPVTDIVRSPLEESSLICSMGTRFSSVDTETGIPDLEANEDPSFEGVSRDVQTSNCKKFLTENTELVSPQVNADSSRSASHRDSHSSTSASTSFLEQHSSDPISENLSTNEDAVVFESANTGVSQVCPESSTLSPQGIEDSHSRRIPVEDMSGEATTAHNSGSASASHASEPDTSHLLGESILETMPSGLGFLLSNRGRGLGDGSVLHDVDLVSLSSSILSGGSADISNREARRNSRRLFSDSFSRRSSRRMDNSPSIFLSMDDNNDTGFDNRWLLDFNSDFFYDGGRGDSGYISSRIHRLNERRRRSRLEIWERRRGGHDGNSRRTTFCPSGIHPDGTCSCDSHMMTDEPNARVSISRIVILAEALFEVLHRQPASFSLSMAAQPAPESVVDSFPLRSHKKVDAAEEVEAVEQCHICLAEYEEGDKIRVLPCQHEFHMPCVDKWLKEIHGVCPLCRGDVCGESSVSNTEITSL